MMRCLHYSEGPIGSMQEAGRELFRNAQSRFVGSRLLKAEPAGQQLEQRPGCFRDKASLSYGKGISKSFFPRRG